MVKNRSTPAASDQTVTKKPVKTVPPADKREPLHTTGNDSPGKPDAPEDDATPHTTEQTQEKGIGRIAIVIDDAGNSLQDLKPFLSSPAKLTIAVLPGLPNSREAARLSRSAGKEIILHLPMEAENGMDTGPGGIFTSDTEQQILATLQSDFLSVPGARGTNNHMGSKATADPRVMKQVMQYLRAEGLFFLDSRTSAASVAATAAQQSTVPFLSRDIFLDNTPEMEYIRTQFEAGMQIALKKGQAVMIGHAQHPEVIRVINEFLPVLQTKGLSLVFLSDLFNH